MKKEYLTAIMEQLEQCQDIELLDLILRLLQKSC